MRALVARWAVAAALLGAAGCDEFDIIATCTDHVTNGKETDVDCGGGDCPRCALGQRCDQKIDCAAGTCVEHACAPPPIGVWTKMSPSDAPSPRHVHSATFDEGSKTTLVFGGNDGASDIGEVWAWNGVTWTNISPLGMSPGPRYGSALVYDPLKSRVVLFGGTDMMGTEADTWVLSNDLWNPLFPSFPPPARRWSAAAYDTKRSTIVLFGGLGGGQLGDTWTGNGDEWTMNNPPKGPLARSAANMVYDPVKEQSLVFGGRIQEMPNVSRNDLWAWDGATWTDVSPVIRPPERFGAVMAHDSVRRRTVLYGGRSDGDDLADTWEWDGSAWTLVFDGGNAPPARSWSTMTYDSKRRRMVLFGGLRFSGAMGTIVNDTWEYYAIGNPCKGPEDCDTGHCIDGLCCEQDGCGTCEACNLPGDPGHCSSCAPCDTASGACKP